MSRRIFIGAVLLALCAADAEEKFADPAPPTVNTPPNIPVPTARANPDVTLHKKPKPLAAGAVTEDWPKFHGPAHNNSSRETKLLKNFDKQPPAIVWEMKMGNTYSAPSIAGERMVFFHRVGNEDVVECLRAENGERFWQFKYPTDYMDEYGYANGPRASPVIDGDRVYVYGAQGILHCLKFETGQLLWKRSINEEFKVPQDFFGISTTPLIQDNLLVISVGAPDGPAVAAFDKMNGKMIWGASANGWGPGYGTPVPAVIHGQNRVFIFAGGKSDPPSGGLISLNPKNGKVDFTFPWRSKIRESVNASCPVVIGNQIFISASYSTGGALLTIKPDFTHEVAWTAPDFGTHWNTAIQRDGYLYGIEGRHIENSALVCYEIKSGKEMWREQVKWRESIEINGESRTVTQGIMRGTLMWADGKCLCLGEYGHLVWMDLTPQGNKVLSRKWLFLSKDSWTPPVINRGLLYVCQIHRDSFTGAEQRLICYDLRGE